MKKRFIKLLFLFAILFTVSFSASAQIRVYVKIRPTVPVIVRTPQPNHDQVWIDEEWEPNGNSYRYVGGHWASPPHRGYVRRSGYWKHSNRGQVWVQGTWRRRY